MRALDAILTVVWAPRCAACDDPLDAPTQGVVCRTCWRRIAGIEEPVCDRCGSARGPVDTAEDLLCGDCRRTGGPPTSRRAAGVHAGALRAIMHAFKYDGRRSLARPLARLMRGRRRRLAAPRRLRRPGAAPCTPAVAAGIQSGSRPRGAPRRTGGACAPAQAPHRPAGRAVAHRAVERARRRVRAGAPEWQASDRRRDPRPLRGARRRRDHDRCDGGSLRRGAPRRRGTGRAGAQRGSGSRGSIAAAISAATTSGACSASMRTQPGCAA